MFRHQLVECPCPSQTEIGNLDLSSTTHKDVGSLDISMNEVVLSLAPDKVAE
jgi:hypothetical protein